MDGSAQAVLIEVARKVTDQRTGGNATDNAWLREFRRVYRHLPVSTGERFGHAHTATALAETDQELDSDAT